MMEEKKVFIQIQCTEDVREQARQVAKYAGVSMSDVLRAYIVRKYKALPEEAK